MALSESPPPPAKTNDGDSSATNNDKDNEQRMAVSMQVTVQTTSTTTVSGRRKRKVQQLAHKETGIVVAMDCEYKVGRKKHHDGILVRLDAMKQAASDEEEIEDTTRNNKAHKNNEDDDTSVIVIERVFQPDAVMPYVEKDDDVEEEEEEVVEELIPIKRERATASKRAKPAAANAKTKAPQPKTIKEEMTTDNEDEAADSDGTRAMTDSVDYLPGIIQTIKELNERNGSAMRTIKTFIKEQIDPEAGFEWNQGEYMSAFDKGVKTGQLFQRTKTIFKLAVDEESDDEPPVKKVKASPTKSAYSEKPKSKGKVEEVHGDDEHQDVETEAADDTTIANKNIQNYDGDEIEVVVVIEGAGRKTRSRTRRSTQQEIAPSPSKSAMDVDDYGADDSGEEVDDEDDEDFNKKKKGKTTKASKKKSMAKAKSKPSPMKSSLEDEVEFVDTNKEEESEKPHQKAANKSKSKKGSAKGKKKPKVDEEQDDATSEEEDGLPPAKLPPKKGANKNVDDDASDVEDSKPASKKKAENKSKAKKASAKAKKQMRPEAEKKTVTDENDEIESVDDNDDNDEDDLPLSSLVAKASGKTKKAASKPKKAPAKKRTVAKAKKPTKAKPRAKKVKLIVVDGEGNNANGPDGDDDGSDSDASFNDRPFKVDRAPSNRATCRRCDSRIEKGDMRISNRPLFRGKPGFITYRHLACATFGDIMSVSQVGGWKCLGKEDCEALQKRIDDALLELEQENKEIHADELVQASFSGELRKPPAGLAATLLPFQTEGTSWMYCQEVRGVDVKGGILADEMGMGKTLQTITAILDNRPKLQHSKPGAKHPPSSPDIEDRKREEAVWATSKKEWEHEMKMSNIPASIIPKATKKVDGGGARAGTLVICPVIALFQWKTEIEKFTEAGALSVGIYHGPKRASEMPREMLCKYDVVLTTYQVLEGDFRKMVSPNKIKCPNCGGKYKIDKLRVHLKYFCGEGAQRTEAQARQRRVRDRNESAGGDDDGHDAKKGKKKTFSNSQSKAKPVSKGKKATGRNVQVKKATAPEKRVIRVMSNGDYESDSELSIADEDIIDISSTKRPSRSAARAASKRLSSSAKEMESENDGDDGSEASEIESSDDDDSSIAFVDVAPQRKARAKGKPKQARKQAASEPPSDSESDSGSDSDGSALERARKKQKLALLRVKTAAAKVNKASTKKGKAKASAKAKGKPKGKAGKHKKAPLPDEDFDEPDDESDDESVGDRKADFDPLEGIDLDGLMKEAMAGSKASILHTVCWWRVVLDEAHMIKSRSSQTATAAFALSSVHRWCLSGTPLQNRVGELYSLIRFLRIDPMAHYFCRKDGCGCKSIHYRMLHGKCQDCGHGSVLHFCHFNKHVLNPIQRDGYQGDGRRAMIKLKEEVLDKSLIRRTKQTRAADMKLPPRFVNIRTIRLHPIEEDFYSALYTQTKSSFDDFVAQGTLLNNYSHIFDLLSKMRQAVDHPYLIVYSKKNMEKMAQLNAAPVANGSVDCDLCNEPPTDRVLSSCCGAAFCRSCVVDFMTAVIDNENEDGTPCPSCRAPFSIDLNQASSDVVDEGTLEVEDDQETTGRATDGMPSLKEMTHVSSGSILRRINLAEFSTSTKLEALIQELVQMRRERPGSKALVFSQFVNMLDLVRWRLHSDPCLRDLGLGVRIIHGGMNVHSRDDALTAFKEDANVRVLLMSLKAGGVALNLTVANEAYLLDPWWNPAAEAQAIDRTHRLGQFRPIRAVRFIAEGTVEERVLQLQEKKRLVFDGTVGRDAASLKMLTVDDMKSLFT